MNSSLSSVTYLSQFFSEDFLLKSFLNYVYAYMKMDLLQSLIAENPSDEHLKGMLRNLLDILNPEIYMLQPGSSEDDNLLFQVHQARLNIREIEKNNGDTTEATAILNNLYDIWHCRLLRRYSEQLELIQNSGNPIPSFTRRVVDVIQMIKENRSALRD